jgi:hypothetical protein
MILQILLFRHQYRDQVAGLTGRKLKLDADRTLIVEGTQAMNLKIYLFHENSAVSQVRLWEPFLRPNTTRTAHSRPSERSRQANKSPNTRDDWQSRL